MARPLRAWHSLAPLQLRPHLDGAGGPLLSAEASGEAKRGRHNHAVYSLLRYGAPVEFERGKVTETVHLIDWSIPKATILAIAEEVTLAGNHERRTRTPLRPLR